MKVLHIITRMNTGGPAVFLDHLTSAMNDLGTQSTIAYGYCESNEADYTEEQEFKANLIRINSLHRTLNPLDDIRAFFQIRKIIKQVNPDLVNTHTSKAGVLGRFAAKSVSKNLPVVHTYLGHLIYGYFGKPKIFIFTLIEKFMSLFTSAAVAVTSETKNSLLKEGVGKNLRWEVIRIGLPNKNVVVNVNYGEQKLNILWVGRFTDIKNPNFAIQTLKELEQKLPGIFELTMVGGGELYNEIVRLSEGLPISFTGWVKDPFQNIEEFDILMMTSKNEGLPLVILEAAMNARPTISTNVGGVSEFILDGKTGYLVGNNPHEMAHRFLDLVKNKKDIFLAGQKAKELLSQEFSAEFMASRHLNLYLDLAKSIDYKPKSAS
jgi:glycosyltransferase involved in cell wall biosynthesis